MDVLKRDIEYLESTTGLDLHSSLESMANAHDMIVAALNPVAAETITENLEQRVATLQQDLAAAHEAVHRCEETLEQTLERLSNLEGRVFSVLRSYLNENMVDDTKGPPSLTPFRLGKRDGCPDERRRTKEFNTEVPSVSDLESHLGFDFRSLRTDNVDIGSEITETQGTQNATSQQKTSPGLQASIALEPELRSFWYPIHFSSKLSNESIVNFQLFGEQVSLYRDRNGNAICQRCIRSSAQNGTDRQDTRGVPFNEELETSDGISLPTEEHDGLIWAYTGNISSTQGTSVASQLHKQQQTRQSCDHPSLHDFLTMNGAEMKLSAPDGYQVHAELIMEVPVDHGLLLENLLDLAHAPFTHTSTFAKGWPIPDSVKFNAAQLLGGSWQPYPIDMAFAPPVMVLSTIGLAQPGKIERGARAADCRNHLHQMHVCLPAKPGHTRLLYRMSLDFLEWSRHIPAIENFWKHIAKQVLGEDLILVEGQQDRLLRGGNTWANPVSYDKLGVRYRRWRNSLKKTLGKNTSFSRRDPSPWKHNGPGERTHCSEASVDVSMPMSAEELFLTPLDEN